jgi:hypothetical protein
MEAPWDGRAFAAAVNDRRNYLALARQFVEAWFGPISVADGFTVAEMSQAEQRLSVRLPRVMHEWYEGFGRQADCANDQDHLENPEELDIEDDVLIIAVENQSCWESGIPVGALALPDPPVVARSREEWEPLNSCLSQFALQWALYGAILTAPYRRYTSQSEKPLLAPLLSALMQLDLPDWHPLHYVSLYFYVADDCVVREARSKDGHSCELSALTERALQRCMSLVDATWHEW